MYVVFSGFLKTSSQTLKLNQVNESFYRKKVANNRNLKRQGVCVEKKKLPAFPDIHMDQWVPRYGGFLVTIWFI